MKYARSDAAITAAVFALSSILFVFFLRDVNALSSGSNADSLGTIEFRKNSATRKAVDSMRWERLRDKAVVYRGDTIRTAELSEAGIKFDDGTELDIFENSMLRLDFSDAAQTFELSGGAMSLTGGEASSPARVIKIGDSLVSVPSDADVSLLSGSGVVSLDVSGGAVSVTSASGAMTTVGANEELRLDSRTGDVSVVKRNVIPESPAQGAQFAFMDGNGTVAFSARATDPLASVTLELSSESSFASPDLTLPLASADGGTFTGETRVKDGVWYWRARTGSGAVSSVRRITVVSSAPPAPVWPEDRAVIGFRKEVPKVRFSWSESPAAVAYTLELYRLAGGGAGADAASTAPERSVRTKLTAITLSSLAEGDWNWRVVPEYPKACIANPVPSATRGFSVVPSDEMRPVALLSPADGTPVDSGETVSFSWANHAEASRYELRLYATEEGSSPLAAFPSEKSWLALELAREKSLAGRGIKYWSVVWFDSDGNESPAAKRRSITSVEARGAVTPFFPPDGYLIADSLAQGVRFSWKGGDATNLAFQLSRDASFATIESLRAVSGNSLLGLSLERGIWYWRLGIANPDGTAFAATEARSFTVVPPFVAPTLKSPKPLSSVTVLEGKSVDFVFGAVKGATRYSCRLYRAVDEGDEALADADTPAFAAENIESPASGDVTVGVPLGSLPEGAYRVALQASAPDGAANTAIGGYLGDETLFVGKIVPVEFSDPKKNAVIDGISARRSGVAIRWKSAFAPDSLTVDLTRDGKRYPLEFAWKSGISSLRIDSLPAGAYAVTITAHVGSFDVSPSSPLRFTVAEIPRLAAPVLTAPADKTVFDQTYLSSHRALEFQWKAVKGATRYAFRILAGNTGKEVFRRDALTGTTFILDDLSCLDKGTFTWEVVAGNNADDGVVDQLGKASSFRFTITLPELSLPSGAKDAEFYGL